ncbi:MAG: cytochrome c biogenesis protein ResB [Candidatus Aureabacteria bacterium]|nr:cytochrome c biogenesis protein ResB [Candidatus Auribacterota bacterium]
MNKLLERLASVRLAIVLLALLIAALILGTLIPQESEPLPGAGIYSGAGAWLRALFGIHDIYHSWWFVLLLTILGSNIILCSITRARRGAPGWGILLTHLSIVGILVGALMTARFAQRGYMSLDEGSSQDYFTTGRGEQKLGFNLKLDKFLLEWNEEPHYRIIASVADRGIVNQFDAVAGERYPIHGSDYSLEIMQYIPDFYLDEEMRAGSRTDSPNNPALRVKIRRGDEVEERWLFSKFPEFEIAKDGNIRLTYASGATIKSFKSLVEIREGDRDVLAAVIEVNRPLHHKGYSFYQASYDLARPHWTGIEVVRDPGVSLVYAGFIFLNLGVILSVYAGLRMEPGGGRGEERDIP